MKVFERILYNELLSRTEAKNKIYHRQGGFLMNKSWDVQRTAPLHRRMLFFIATLSLNYRPKIFL